MATKRWVGLQRAVAQVQIFTILTYDAATTYKIGIPSTTTGKVVSTLGTGGTTTTTATALLALLQAETSGEFAEITWTSNANIITGTATTPGKPFTAATAVSGGAGTISNSVTTANLSPNDLNDALNWDTNTLPGNNDTLIFDTGDISVLWNLSALSALTGITLNRYKTYTGIIGLAEYDTDTDGGAYYQYRAQELTFTGGTFYIEMSQDMDAQSFKLNVGGTAATVNANGESGVSGGAVALFQEQIWFRGTGGNTVNVTNGSIGIALGNQQSATVTTLTAQNSTARCGLSTTITTAKNRDAVIEINGGTTTSLEHAGPLGQSVTFVKNAATITNAPNINDGILIYMSSATLTGPTIGTDAAVDFSQDPRSKTVSGNVTMRKNATWNDPYNAVSSVTFVTDASINELTFILSPGKTIAIS